MALQGMPERRALPLLLLGMDKLLKFHFQKATPFDKAERLKPNGWRSKEHGPIIEEALQKQAKIEHLSRGGHEMEIYAWANVCPDCDVVCEYRAAPVDKFVFGKHGPVAEQSRCSECHTAFLKPQADAEYKRWQALSESEQAEERRLQMPITQAMIDAEVEAKTDAFKILKMMNNIGQPLSTVEKAKK
jgi:hypothetical protein